jgi:hypothetical protein
VIEEVRVVIDRGEKRDNLPVRSDNAENGDRRPTLLALAALALLVLTLLLTLQGRVLGGDAVGNAAKRRVYGGAWRRSGR